MVGAAVIEPTTLKIGKLFNPLDRKNGKNSMFSQPRYTAGTWKAMEPADGT
jgi:hypothetical protein